MSEPKGIDYSIPNDCPVCGEPVEVEPVEVGIGGHVRYLPGPASCSGDPGHDIRVYPRV